MPGNSQRKGAVRKKGKTTPAGSGGRVRRGLEGKGPTPKAEDRPYHKAYRRRGPDEPGKSPDRSQGSPPATGRPSGNARPSRNRTTATAGADWVIGRNAVLEALQAGLPVKRAFIAEGAERDSRLRDILAFTADHGVPLLQATRTELDRLTGGGVHQGVALQVPEYDYADVEDVLAEALHAEPAGLVVALDSITDPRNLGAIIRSAAAFGAQGVIIPERRSAHLTAAAWKTSAGAAARVPVAMVTNLNRTLKSFSDAGFTVVGLAGEADTDLAGFPGIDGPVLLVVGSEGDGLARLVRENCDVLASIPITSAVESLNASVAAAIALYEITRSRG
ncbi:MAG: 23S rRNA (guanosine(2251)-2'-O)-methyltransferase RlmB [Propionicimonas sp.]|uniref:23S rRNA (guanosine(2251)-2'-O)-methyltransferase RlmB n=1 Tax=Propionicimonas sp. TaxID=1955623 RepID=UPI002B1EE904|nr:23S rRNA (guanosine(2251)-2'-O)-methyltransferase RlmB [Propionicimonas sp.]MEA4944176.1 23S rRNA (guanosine(2251)-2'-O)-methyltransferase RlmB [Propionicimonas sp.]